MPTENEKRWIAAWKSAGPELERIRNEELQQLDDQAGLRSLGAFNLGVHETNGLVIFQAWMSRYRSLQLMQQLKKLSRGSAK